MAETVFRCGDVWGGMRRQVGCQEPAGALWWSWWVRVARGAVMALERLLAGAAGCWLLAE